MRYALPQTIATFSSFNCPFEVWHSSCQMLVMFSEVPYNNLDLSHYASGKAPCTKCKKNFEADDLNKCGLCSKKACRICSVKRYGKKFCSERCMSFYGLDGEADC
jgi:hypothetical protein